LDYSWKDAMPDESARSAATERHSFDLAIVELTGSEDEEEEKTDDGIADGLVDDLLPASLICR
jgi:hypothetical protein